MSRPASLRPPRSDRLLEFLRELRSGGRTILFISHRLGEVFSIADRITVLRKGRVAATRDTRKTSREEIAHLMVSGPGKPDGASCRRQLSEQRSCGPVPPDSETGTAAPRTAQSPGRSFGRRTGAGGSFPFGWERRDFRGGGNRRERTKFVCPRACRKNRGRERDHFVRRSRYHRSDVKGPAAGGEFAGFRKILSRSHSCRAGLCGRISFWAARRIRNSRAKAFCSGKKSSNLRGSRSTRTILRPRAPLTRYHPFRGEIVQKAALAGIFADSPHLAILEQPSRGLDLHASARLKEKSST